MRKCRRTREESNPPESDQFRLARRKPAGQLECRPALLRRRCLPAQADPELASRPEDRLRSIESAMGSACSLPDDTHFLTLPGGGSLITAQKTPSSLMAFTNS